MIVHCKNVETFKVTKSHSEVVGMQLFGILKINAVIAICDQKTCITLVRINWWFYPDNIIRVTMLCKIGYGETSMVILYKRTFNILQAKYFVVSEQ